MSKRKKYASEMLYHYTYRITNIVEKKYYYGVHSCDCLPKEDIGVKYFSTSKNKAFKQDINDNPQNYKYKVLKVFSTRLEAVEHEIFLHKKFNVKTHKSFYNGANQTSTKFDTTGVKYTDEVNKSKGRKGGVKNLTTNNVMIKIAGKCVKITKDEFDRGLYVGVTKNMVLTKEIGYVSTEEFKNGNFTSIHAETVTIIDNGLTRRITKDEFDKGGYSGVNKNMAVCRDINFNVFRINKNNTDLYKGVIGSVNNKYNYIVTDTDGNTYEIVSIYRFAEYHNLPVNKLIKNANNGIITYTHDRKMKNLKDINGWQVVKFKPTC